MVGPVQPRVPGPAASVQPAPATVEYLLRTVMVFEARFSQEDALPYPNSTEAEEDACSHLTVSVKTKMVSSRGTGQGPVLHTNLSFLIYMLVTLAASARLCFALCCSAPSGYLRPKDQTALTNNKLQSEQDKLQSEQVLEKG